MSTQLDSFLPNPDVDERHEILVRAPAEFVMDAARRFDFQSLPIVRAIFWLRSKLMGAREQPGRQPVGLVAATTAMGWGVLTDQPVSLFIAGSACQPWKADVVFTPIAPEKFLSYSEPDRVKIAWTLEAEPLGPALTRFATETRVVATDEQARRKFGRYWRLFSIGILAIRRIMLSAVRKEAQLRFQNVRK